MGLHDRSSMRRVYWAESSVARSSADRFQLITGVQEFVLSQLFHLGHGEPAQLDQLVVIPVEFVDVGFRGVHHVRGALVVEPADGGQFANVEIKLFKQFASDCRLRLFTPFNTTAWKSPSPGFLAPEAGMHGKQKVAITMQNTAGSFEASGQGDDGC